MKHLILASLIGFFATHAIAHSPLKATDPANATTITAAPEQLALTFGGNMRLVGVTVSLDDAEAVDLDLGDNTEFATTFTLPFQDLGSGTYLVVWRGLGDDGHAQTGTFSFIIE